MNKACIYLLVLARLLGINHLAYGNVWCTPFYADSNTPVPWIDPNTPDVYKDIMVGTQLELMISSDSSENWSGAMRLYPPYDTIGMISFRDYNDVTGIWEGSILPAAYTHPRPFLSASASGLGRLYNFATGFQPEPGDWFLVDYYALEEGECVIVFFSLPIMDPVQILNFNHVPTRDFNNDGLVNFSDWAQMASCWELDTITEANDPNLALTAGDLDKNDHIDTYDMSLFFAFWLSNAQ